MKADYLNKTVWVTLGVSKIHGIGVIAVRDIPKGTRFTDYNLGDYDIGIDLITMTQEEFNKIIPEIRNLILDKTVMTKSISFFSPNAVQDLRSWMNHSSSPNTKDFTTTIDIKKGEELTENYKWFGDLHEISANHYSFL